jgi:hypothetical protein
MDGHMDGHWEWSEGGDDADTADLGGDTGHDLHADLHGDPQGEYGADFGGDEHLHGGFGGDPAGGGDDLEEPLGTEHAAQDYDQSLHDNTGDADDSNTAGDGGYHADFTTDGDGSHLTFEPGHDTGAPDHGDDGPDPVDSHEAQETHEATFGADPDVDASADDPAWQDVTFPEALDLDHPPEPVDGFPWTDADVLGGPDHSLSAAYDPAAGGGPAAPADLAAYAGADLPPGGDPWSLLLGSDDPATSSLATFWAPQS